MRVPDWISRSGPAAPVDQATIREDLARALRPETFRHCLAVRDHAAAIAPAFGADPETAALAGLLHDNAKNLSAREQLAAAEAAGLEIFPAERASPKVLHQRLGALFAARRFGVTDPSVIEAIACHTTGQGPMDALARCLFVADYTSPERRFHGVETLRAALLRGADAGFLAVLRCKRDLVLAQGLPEHPWAEAAHARYL